MPALLPACKYMLIRMIHLLDLSATPVTLIGPARGSHVRSLVAVVHMVFTYCTFI